MDNAGLDEDVVRTFQFGGVTDCHFYTKTSLYSMLLIGPLSVLLPWDQFLLLSANPKHWHQQEHRQESSHQSHLQGPQDSRLFFLDHGLKGQSYSTKSMGNVWNFAQNRSAYENSQTLHCQSCACMQAYAMQGMGLIPISNFTFQLLS